ncbi:hypothetical protein V495_02931 [Pseudogymnoascus sp. VKM F-4514 (FW-929)]|nr:hypothetical protein V495_02931 [Pseudogymnoascus sp. VKM F-4514 (FW-929)]KFY61166.1 hypothetical protein V497_03112 [Pseudogymnoascus sp. VKM F-4516 (FW-969)]
MSTKPIRRLTLFKIPTEEGQEQLLAKYRSLPQEALKDNAPYLLDIQAGKTFPDQRAQGFTLAVSTVFKNKEDMLFYDTECTGHAGIKKVAMAVHKGIMTVQVAVYAIKLPFLSIAEEDFTNASIDFEAYAMHAKFVTAPGIFPVVSASIGEAAHLDSQERIKLIQTLRLALDDIGLYKTPIVAGVGAHSTRQTTQLAHDAAAAGADFVLVVPPGYYAGVLKTNPTAIRKFFIDVAAASPVPVIIYNFPAVSAGIDLSSDDVVEIAKAAPNICGIMLSCGNVGKLARITALVNNSSFKTLAGFIDFLLPSVAVGSAGAISPLPNVAPNFSSKLWQVAQSLGSGVDFQEAKELQGKASLGEIALLKEGLLGLKGLLNQQFGYPAAPRLPLMVVSNDAVTKMSANKHLEDVMAQEKILETIKER